MKKYFIIGAAAALLTTSCSTDVVDNTEVDNTGKERIVLGAGDNQSALISRAGFSDKTRIVARYVSETRGGSEKKCVTTLLTAKDAESKTYSDVEYVEGNTRYWDDAYGRNSILSVYAVAIPNKKDDSDATNLPSTILKGSSTWGTANADDNTLSWSVKAEQTVELLANEDLTYSNNIQQSGKNGVYTWSYTSPEGYPAAGSASHHVKNDVTDGRLYFTQSADYTATLNDGPGHFDKGQMEFNHALTRIQVNLKKGDGYSTAPFTVTSMQVLAQHVAGTFDIKNASWTPSGDATAINMASLTPKADMAATYEAQMLPGYTFAADNENVLKLIVDGNTYFITNNMLRTALTDVTGVNADFSTEISKRYIFTLDVTKNKIQNITATIVEWNDINAKETTVNNSHLSFNFYNGGTACTDINLYKYMQTLDKVYTDDSYTANPVAGSAYTEVAGLTPDGSTGKYTTSEFYNDNQTAYHFRSINNTAEGTIATTDGKTYFTMTSGEADESTNDYHWGAPMKATLPDGKLTYDTANGYLDCIDKGIVAASTESNINLTEVHMMSQIVVKLTTPTTGAAVTLADATVKITKFSKTGTVDMGSGKITPATGEGIGDMDTPVTVTTVDGVTSCTINVVPQLLKRNSGASDDDYVGITIKTTDNNEYYIVKRLSEIIATSVGSEVTNMQEAGAGKYITRWYPGHKYIYTFNITKTEIKNITATIVGWNEVVAGNTNLDLEK